MAGFALRRFLPQTLVRTVPVIAPGVLGQDASEMPPPRGDRRSNWELALVTSRRGRRDGGRVVRQYAQLREQGGKSDVAVEHLDLAVTQVPEVGGREVDLGPRGLDRASGRLERPKEGALDRPHRRSR